MKSRKQEAVSNFKAGFNCAQSVFITYADLYGIDRELALKMSCSFGGGMGRMREVCGCVSGMLLLAGFETGNTEPKNQEAKKKNYELVRELADEYKNKNKSIICRELLGLDKREDSASPGIRTDEYYKKRPCVKLVEDAAGIVENILYPGRFEE